MGARRIKVLIADDHALVREGITLILERQEDLLIVGEASDGQEAVDMYRVYQPDVTLLDLRMPKMDGVEAIKAIRQEFPAAKIVILTTYEGEEDIYRGLQAGAKGYLLKDSSRDELVEAIHAVCSGQTRVPADILAKLAERIRQPALTPRETDVLRLITQGQSNQEIANALFITEGTVKSHINSILSKMGVSDRTQAAIAAIKRGLFRLP